jgi:hypothetical protein
MSEGSKVAGTKKIRTIGVAASLIGPIGYQHALSPL